MSPEDILAPITRVLLKENENCALAFPLTAIAKEPRFALYFFRVMRRYPLHRTYDEEMPSISAGGKVEPNYVGDGGIGTGKDLLTVWEERPFRLLHFSFGIRPSEIWLYRSIPAGVSETGWAYELPPRVGDKRDYVDGFLSPYDQPTVAGEGIIYNKLTTHVGFFNSSARTIRPSLRLLGAGYDTVQITDKGFIDRMISGRIPCRFITVGGLMPFTYTVPEVWKPPTEVDRATIERVMAGGRP